MSEPLGAFKTPLGAFEPNVILAGLEASAAAWIAVVLIADRPLIPPLPRDWNWSYAVFGLVLLVGIILLGLCVEGLAGMLERRLTWGGGRLRPWYERRVPPPTTWGPAQLWIWQSPQASDEFARRRLRLLTARNTAFVIALLTVALAIGLPLAKPPAWGWKVGIAVVAGVVSARLFVWVWIAAQQAYNQAVQDAASVRPPNG